MIRETYIPSFCLLFIIIDEVMLPRCLIRLRMRSTRVYLVNIILILWIPAAFVLDSKTIVFFLVNRPA